MSSGWTPGPWYVLDEEVPDAWHHVEFFQVSSGDMGTKDYRPVAWGIGVYGYEISTESLANARLIACAPTLYTELDRQLHEHFATWMAARAEVEGAETSERLFEMEPATIRARALLAKARGETP